jgi:ribosomal protein S13
MVEKNDSNRILIMAKINEETKIAVKSLNKNELEKLVIKAASKDDSFYNYLLVNYVDKEFGEQDLYEKARIDIELLVIKSYKGYSEELQLANKLAACHKRINEFSKICKNKEFELNLIMQVLKIPFSLSTNLFCTCFTNYNYRVSLLLKKAISLLQNKLHQDYAIEYSKVINTYLETLHRTCNYLYCVSSLPHLI